MVSRSSCLARLLTLGFTLAAILLLVVGVIYWSRVQKFNRAIAKLEADGIPTKWADLIPKEKVPNEDNAIWILESKKDRFADLVKRTSKIIEGINNFTDPLTEELAKELEAEFAQDEELFDLLDRAMETPESQPLLDYTNPDALNFVEASTGFHNTTRVLQLKLRTLLFRGKHDEAFNLSLTGLKLAELVNDYPTLISEIASSSRRDVMLSSLGDVLNAKKLSVSDSKILEELLRDADGMEFAKNYLITERINSLDNLVKGPAFANPILEMFEKELEFGTQSNFEIEDLRKDFYGELSPIFGSITGEIWVKNYLPAINNFRNSICMVRAMMRSVRVLNALQQMNADVNTKIADIDLPENAKIDPFTGEPLIIKKTVNGWSVYSVGPDKKDDGGFFDGNDFGVGLAPPDHK